MSKPRSAITRAKAKCKRHDGKVWCGYLTPSDIALLLKEGCKAEAGTEWNVNYAAKKMAEGNSRPTWFYFVPPKDFFPPVANGHAT